MLVWIIISNRFDSLRLTHIYTCQQGMSTRYFVISYNSIFFNRSYNVSTIYHPLRSSDIVGKLASKNQVNIVNAVVLLLPQASVIKGSNSSVCAHACVRACACARARVCVCVWCTQSRRNATFTYNETAIIDDTPTASLMVNVSFRSGLRTTSLTTLGCCGRGGITDARTDLRLRRTYLHYTGNTRPTYCYAWVSWNVVPCYTFDFQRCLQWQMRSTRDDTTQFDRRDRREILHFL